MVHFRSTATFLTAALSVARLALGGTTGPTFTVLTGTSTEACSPDKVAILQTRLTETITLAKAASDALKVEGAETSPVFKDFLGNAVPKKVETQHYAPITTIATPVNIRSVDSDEGHKPRVKATAPAHETLLMCLPPTNSKCTWNGFAGTVHAIAIGSEQVVLFCPLFFGGVTKIDPKTKKAVLAKSLSLNEGRWTYIDGKGAYATGAMVLLHELQHLPSVVGDSGVLHDLYIKTGAPKDIVPRPANIFALPQGIVGAYAKKDCIGLPEDKKATNTQNVAFYALDVYAFPHRAKPVEAASDASKTPNAGEKVVAKVDSKTPKRFEAIYQRRAHKEATADTGA